MSDLSSDVPDAGFEGFVELLSPPAKSRFQREVRVQAVEPATRLLERGDAISGAYLVSSGRVRVFAVMSDGTETTLYTLGAGEACVLALNCMFGGTPYPAWAEAEEQSRIALIPAALYRGLFRSEPAVQDLTVNALSVAVTRLMAEIESLHALRFDQRLLRFVRERADLQGKLRMTHEQLARHLGVSREMVSRALGKLAGEGVLGVGRGTVTLRSA